MDHSEIPLILQELNLNEDDVTNIYHHGSWVYGTNSPTSDRDLLIITRSYPQAPLKFWTDFDYFHDFKSSKVWRKCKYDCSIYTIENFEILLKNNYLLVVQCLFLPDEFKIKEEIDFRKIYLEKYYNKLRLKQSGFYEMYRDWKLYKPENDSSNCLISDEQLISRRDYIFKHFFHGLRYLDFTEQLIQTQSIYNYKRITHIYDEMKNIRGDPRDNSSLDRVAEFVLRKSIELKSKLDIIVPTNIINGSFEVYITFDCTHNTEQIINKLKITCQNTKYKIILIQLKPTQDKNKFQQVIVTSNYYGEYPSIVKQIEEETFKQFQDFNIIRIKIESLTSNEGIPQIDIDKKLFWDRQTNYFEFHYVSSLEEDRKGIVLQKLLGIYKAQNKFNLDVSRNGFMEIDENIFHYINSIRLFNIGQEKAFTINDQVIEYSIKNNLQLSMIKHVFIVYDKSINLNNE